MSAIFYYLFLALVFAVVSGAPRGKSPSLTYDQKQTGEYNIQLHLKDFQIIAVVGEDSLGSLGDYDYNYDYSDFTIRPPPSTPSTPSTTTSSKPEVNNFTESTVLSSTTLKTTTKKQNTDPYPILSPVTTTAKTLQVENATQTTTTPKVEITTPLVSTFVITESVMTEKVTVEREPPKKLVAPEVPPGQIPVIVQEVNGAGAPGFPVITPVPVTTQESSGTPEAATKDKKKGEAVTIIGAADDANNLSVGSLETTVTVRPQTNLGEIMQMKRCASGYARDKRGRCRKIRRPPQIPIEITRFASNLAAHFRQVSGTDQHQLLPEVMTKTNRS